MGAFDSLRYRDYRLFWSGAFLSNIGSWMQNTALSWYVLVLTHSAFWVGALTFVNLFPTWLSPVGGVVADRVERRSILFSTQTFMMVDAAALAALATVHRAGLPAVMLLTFGLGLAFAFNGPTWQAFIPSLVPREAMINAIALNSTQFSMARVVGPAIAGILIGAAGVGPVFWINAGSFVTVLIALALIRSRKPPIPSGVRPLESLRIGLRYTARHRVVRTLILSLAVLSFFGAPVIALLPVYAKDVFHHGAGAFGTLAAAMGAGSVLGALALGRRGRTSPALVAWALVAVGVALAAFAATASFIAGTALMVVFGAGYLFSISAINTGIQTAVEDAVRGRVMSLFMLAFGGIAPIGSLVAGAVAEATGVRATTLVGAGVCLAWGLGLAVWSRRPAPAI